MSEQIEKKAPDKKGDGPPIIRAGDAGEINLSGVIPLKMRHWRELRSKGLDIMELPKLARTDTLTMEHIETIGFYVVKLAAPHVTEDNLLDMTLADLQKAAATAMTAEAQGGSELDRPTSTPSISSPSVGAGDPAISTS